MDPGKKWTSGNSPSYWAEWEGSQLRDREFLGTNEDSGTGSLIATNKGWGWGHHILTAAHVFKSRSNRDINVRFDLQRGGTPVPIRIKIPANVPGGAQYQVEHSAYGPGFTPKKNDIGLLVLTDQRAGMAASDRLLVAPFTAQKYGLYNDGIAKTVNGKPAEVDNLFTVVGYGMTGIGKSGQTPGTTGEKRVGQNRFDATGAWYGNATMDLVADFDRLNDPAGKANLDPFDKQYIPGVSVTNAGLGKAEAQPGPGDSGGPAFIGILGNQTIAAVVSSGISITAPPAAIAPDIDGKTNTTFGEVAFYTNVSQTIGDTNLQAVLAPAGTKDAKGVVQPALYDLVLDMNYQVFGQSDRPVAGGKFVPDNLVITASTVGGNLRLTVGTGDEASPLSGVYYEAPAANIRSLTIRGSSDNEMFIISGPLGLAGSKAVTLEGGGGNDFFYVSGLQGATPGGDIGRLTIDGGVGEDTVFISETTATGDGHQYTLGATPGWDMRLSRGTNTGPAANPIQPTEAVDSKGVEDYFLATGSGSDLIRVDATPATLTKGLWITAGKGNDEIRVGSAAEGLQNVKGFIGVSGGPGFDRLIVDDAKGAAGGKYTVTANEIQRTGGPRIKNADNLFRVLKDSQGGVNNNLGGLVGGPEADLAILGDTGADVATVDGIDAAAKLTFDGDAGTDRLTVVSGHLTDPDVVNVETGEVTGGTLTVANRNLAFATFTESGGTLNRLPSGATGGSTLAVTNAVTLAGSLQVTVPASFTASVGMVLGLINNLSSSPINGTFASLPEGTLISVGGWTFSISYLGILDPDEVENDAVLIVVSTPTSSGNTASLSGNVWDDESSDGLRQSTEPFAQGVAVDLTDTNGNSLRATTDANGEYNFANLAAGDYTLHVDQSASSTYAGYRFTTQNTTTNPDSLPDSDVDPVTGNAGPFTLASGQTLAGVDAGLVANSAPEGAGDVYSVSRDETLTVASTADGVLGNDFDNENDSLSAVLVAGPTHGTLTLNADGSFEYTPTPGFVGVDEFTYRAVDAFGPGSVAVATISVNDNPPIAANDTATTDEDTSTTIAVLSNDDDPDGDTFGIASVGTPEHGTAIIQGGNIVYSPDPNWHGTDTFSYLIENEFGVTSKATVTVTVTPVNEDYDPDSDFPTTSSTNGQWSYGWANTLTSAFIPGDSLDFGPDLTAWGTANLPAVFHNGTNHDVGLGGTVLLHPGELALHPGPQGQYGVVQFTVPASGYYQISAAFGSRDTGHGGTDSHVRIGDYEAFEANITTTDGVTMTPQPVFLTEGEVVSFRVGWGSNSTYYNDSTSLDASITEVEAPTAPTSFNPETDFSPLDNSGNPWVFGSTPTLGGTFTSGSRFNIASGIAGWGTGTGDNLPSAFKNLTPTTQTFANTVTLASGELALHPGSNGEKAVARFIVPSAGYYEVDAAFAGRDVAFGTTDAHILLNNVEMFSAMVTNNAGIGMTAPRVVYLAYGDTLDFVVGSGPNNYYNDSTNLDVTITPVSGPPTVASDAAGAFSPLSNPNDDWSFGWSPTLTGSFTAGTAFDLAPGALGWGASTIVPGVFENVTDQTQTFVNTVTLAAGELALHPGSNGEYGVARFVAPVSGTYSIGGAFAGRDSAFGTTDAHIQVAGIEVFSSLVTDHTGVGLSSPLTMYLAAGDSVDYRVGIGGNNHFNDSTALDAAVTLVSTDQPTISIGDVSQAEGDSSTTDFTFTVSMSHASTETVAVNYETINGTATAGSDYTSASETLTFNPGETSKTFTIQVVGDTTYESDETFTVDLSNATNATIATSQATGTIQNDDNQPTASISIANVSGNEGGSGTTFSFVVSLSNASSETVTVQYTTADGSAIEGSDYTATSGTLTFNPDETSKTVNVAVIGDNVHEPDETFTVNLSNAANATIDVSQGTGTILNDDNLPIITVLNVSQAEGISSTAAFNFLVGLSNPSSQVITLEYTTTDGTATTANSDYIPTSGTVTFNPGETSKTVPVQVVGDTTYESDETFAVNFSSPTNATIATSQATGTIQNDDNQPTATISIANVSGNEGNSGLAVLDFQVSLSNASSETVTVNYTTTDVTTTAGSDYVPTSGILTFNPGETVLTIPVAVKGDTTFEPDETFAVNVSNPSNANIAVSQATWTILNDDSQPTISIGNVSQAEGNSESTAFVFTVTLSNPSSQTVSVDYGTANGSALATSDYTAASGTVTFDPGETVKTITIQVTGDTTSESDESFVVNLFNATNASIFVSQASGTIINDDSSIGDFVWYDVNADGIFNGAEVGASGITVTLMGGELTSPLTTTTDASGHYVFADLGAGNFTATFTAPEGYGFSTPQGGVHPVNLGVGQNYDAADAGLTASGSGSGSGTGSAFGSG